MRKDDIERLKKMSILDLMDVISALKPIGSIRPVTYWKSPISNFLQGLQLFLYYPYLFPLDLHIQDFFTIVMQRPKVWALVKTWEHKFEADSVLELRRKIREDVLPKLDVKDVDFADPNFVIWVSIFALITWELSKRLELGKNPAGYNIDSSLLVYFHKMSKEPSSQKRADAIVYKALGIDSQAELLKNLQDDAKRISWEKEGEAYGFLIEEIMPITSKFAALSEEELWLKCFESDEDVHCAPNRVKNKLIDDYRKQDENRRNRKVKEYEKSKALEFGTKYDISKSFPPLESLPDISKLHEVEKTSDLEKWIETLKDSLDKKIARLSFMGGLTVRQIAEKLSIPRSTIQDRLKKLKPPI